MGSEHIPEVAAVSARMSQSATYVGKDVRTSPRCAHCSSALQVCSHRPAFIAQQSVAAKAHSRNYQYCMLHQGWMHRVPSPALQLPLRCVTHKPPVCMQRPFVLRWCILPKNQTCIPNTGCINTDMADILQAAARTLHVTNSAYCKAYTYICRVGTASADT